MSLNKDSVLNTFIVATVLCLVCALVVSSASVALKPIQSQNAQLDRKKNILEVTGFSPEEIEAGGGTEAVFKDRFTAVIIDLNTGKEALEACETAMEVAKGKPIPDVLATYDQLWASKRKDTPLSIELEKKQDFGAIKNRENFSHVYILKSIDGKIETYVFPVRGMGLWSLMQGYFAVEPDFQTVKGLTYYQQGETAGLGGEVQNPQWKKKWIEKQIFDDNGTVALKVSKGDQSGNEYGVDALSGATITSNGVTNMIKFWMGDNGFGPYIELNKSGSTTTPPASGDGGNDE
ncbi:MAG: Na+-transporting NADH:ubiquinone oxidoreductase subunit C [Mariniblastus sp.]|jgi:Na+-transporting NADH:ubiquinone oxidoreductase subunit C